jgi:hypothetical protein
MFINIPTPGHVKICEPIPQSPPWFNVNPLAVLYIP